MKEKITFKNIPEEIQLVRRRCWLAGIGMLILFILLIARFAYLTLYAHKSYVALSESHHLHKIPIDPPRGLITDRNGIVLADNVPVYSLDVIPSEVKNFTAEIAELRTLLTLDDASLRRYQQEKKHRHSLDDIPLKLSLTAEERAIFAENQYRFPGFVTTARFLRHYPFGEDTASIVGYVGRISDEEIKHIDAAQYAASPFIGKTGVEKEFENRLHGKVGYEQIQIDARGKPVDAYDTIPPTTGETLQLTIDYRLQAAAKAAFGTETGALVALDPNTGEVLALYSHPSFDPNVFVQGITPEQYSTYKKNSALLNRALNGIYPLASTIKPFIALGALDKGVITPSLTIYDPGYFMLPNSKHVFHDWKYGGHGEISLKEAIIVSCDTYFYYTANLLGIHNLDTILLNFGFGTPPNIDLPGASSGVVPTPAWKQQHISEPWYPGNTLLTGIGQGYISTTPLQLAEGVAAIASRGKRWTSHVLRSDAITPLKTVILNNPTNWELVISAMQEVITSLEGTALHFGRHPEYTVAGKTGTAQIITREQKRQFKKIYGESIPKNYANNSLFIAFAPIDHPKIALAVVVEHADTAAIIARKVLDTYLLSPKTKDKT